MFSARPQNVKYGKSSSSGVKPEGLYDATVTSVVFEGSLSVSIDAIIDTPTTSLSVGFDSLVGSLNETGLKPRVYAQIPRLVSGFEFGPLDFIGPIPSVGDRAFVGFKEGSADNMVLLAKGVAGTAKEVVVEVTEGAAHVISETEPVDPPNGLLWTHPTEDGNFPHVHTGYLFGGTVYYTTPGADTFDKADYPGLRAVMVECLGGQGQGGGCAATGSGEASIGGGGGGGGYARSFILVDDLDTSEAVTVGAGGSSGTAGNDGQNGADSVFDTISGEVRGQGGVGGTAGAVISSFPGTGGASGVGGGGTGDFVSTGARGSNGMAWAQNRLAQGIGGASLLYPSPLSAQTYVASASDGTNGGGGARNTQSQSARPGGAGLNGIVIVGLYY